MELKTARIRRLSGEARMVMGPREKNVMSVLIDGHQHSTRDIMMESAQKEVDTQGRSSNDARAILHSDAGYTDCFWRKDTHAVLQQLVDKGFIVRTERGWYRATQLGIEYMKKRKVV